MDKNKNNYIFYPQNIIQNDATITKNDDIQSCETEKIFSTPNNHSQRIATTSSSMLNLNISTILPPVGK